MEFKTVEDALEFLIKKQMESGDEESIAALGKIVEFVELQTFGKVNPGNIV